MTDSSTSLGPWRLFLRHGPGALRHFVDHRIAARPWLQKLVVLFTALVVLVLFVDLPLASFVRRAGFQTTRPLWDAIENFGRAEPYIAMGLLGYIGFLHAARRLKGRPVTAQWARGKARHFAYFLLTLAGSAAIIHLLKLTVGRLRPAALFREEGFGFFFNFQHNPFDSFPSGHTQTAFAVAAALAAWQPRYRWVFYGLAALVAAARIVQSAHWLSDTVAAAVLTLMVAAFWRPIVFDPARDWPGQSPLDWRRKS